jgi:hypothetical protein
MLIKSELGSLTIILVWLILGIYMALINVFIDDEFERSLLAYTLQRDGVFFCVAITIIKLFELIRERWLEFVIRLFLVFVVYIIVYGLMALPYMLVSFLQPVYRNVVLHFAIIFCVIEYILDHFRNEIHEK